MDRPAVWRCGGFEFDLARPLVMGILNVTPDSFSDGGTYLDRDAAVAAGLRMMGDGADIVDVGGESTRPGSQPVTVADEIDRVVSVVRALAQDGVCVSIDTRHAEVAAQAVAAGAAILNDVSGFTDPAMLSLAASGNAGLVVMHMRGDPHTMQDDPAYAEVVSEVVAHLTMQAAALENAGVSLERIALDPGIGFGKTTEHNLALLRALPQLTRLGFPVLVGASRKRFIGEITGVIEPRERLGGSIAAALDAVSKGAAIVRVHDVAATVQGLAVMRAIKGEGEEA